MINQSIKRKHSIKKYKRFFPLMMVAMYPFVWCFAVAGHAHHAWTYWNYSILLFAVLQVFWEIGDFDANKRFKY